jgi:hypothetical protein
MVITMMNQTLYGLNRLGDYGFDGQLNEASFVLGLGNNDVSGDSRHMLDLNL